MEYKKADNKLIQKGIVLYLSSDSHSERIGFWGSYDYLILSKFRTLNVSDTSAIEVFTLITEDLIKLKEEIESTLNPIINNYSEPEVNESDRKFSKSLYKVEYNEIVYELESRRSDHNYILECIRTLKYINRAIGGNFYLKICFINRFRYQEDCMLRYLHYVKNDNSNIRDLEEYYEQKLSKERIVEIIESLKKYDCITFDGNNIVLTELGKNIV